MGELQAMVAQVVMAEVRVLNVVVMQAPLTTRFVQQNRAQVALEATQGAVQVEKPIVVLAISLVVEVRVLVMQEPPVTALVQLRLLGVQEVLREVGREVGLYREALAYAVLEVLEALPKALGVQTQEVPVGVVAEEVLVMLEGQVIPEALVHQQRIPVRPSLPVVLTQLA
jgi:hypothetical protein